MNSNSSSFGGRSSLTRAPSGGTIWGCYQARASASTLGEGGGRRGEAPLCSPVCPARSPSPMGRTRLRAACSAPGPCQGTSASKHKPWAFAASLQPHPYEGSPRFVARHGIYTHAHGRTCGGSYAPTWGHTLSHACACWAGLTRPRLITTIQLAIKAKRFFWHASMLKTPLATPYISVDHHEARLPWSRSVGNATRPTGRRGEPSAWAIAILLPMCSPAHDVTDRQLSERAITAHKCALLSFLLNLLLAALHNPSPINQLVANLVCSIRTAAH